MYQMLKLVDTARMEEIESYVQLVRVKHGNFNVEELDYGCGPSSALVAVIDRCEVNEDNQDCEDEACDEDGDNESDGVGDV